MGIKQTLLGFKGAGSRELRKNHFRELGRKVFFSFREQGAKTHLLVHGPQSSSVIAKYNDNKFICGTSHYAPAEFKTCKRLHVLLFYYQLTVF